MSDRTAAPPGQPSTGGAPGARGGLLAVHAHPDDETLATGALLATWAAAGRPVTVVTCTRGEAGEVIGPLREVLEGTGPALAAHREAELAGALAALGVDDHLFLDRVLVDRVAPAARGSAAQGQGATDGSAARYVDSGMAWLGPGQAGSAAERPDGAFVDVPVDTAARRLAHVIRQRRPQVLVSYEPGGGYGHPDHVHAHRVAQRAVELAAACAVEPAADAHDSGLGDRGAVSAGGPWDVPVVLWSVLPAETLRQARATLAEIPSAHGIEGSVDGSPSLLSPDAPDGPMPSGAVPQAQVDVEVDVSHVLARLTLALEAHATQVQAVATAAQRGFAGRAPVIGWFALSNGVLMPLLPVESYRATTRRPERPVRWPDGVRVRVA